MAIADLRHYIRIYEGDLEPPLCQRMIDSFNSLSRYQQPKGRGHRVGLEDSAWTELNVTGLSDESFLRFFRARIDLALDRYNRDVGLDIEVPNSPKIAELILKRYRAGADEQFQQHFDSIYEVANRYLVLFWYLNDVATGGETVFPQLDIKIAARQGRLLVFPPYWMYQHAGLPPESGEKYILSTYLLF
ncbi:MAG: 2OG-Fe(II) oxygenase [Steroidobacteraceae bacterium]